MSQTAPKVALVTGAARGIGLATAKRFLAEGWRVALLDIDGDTLTRSHAALVASSAGSGATMAISCDVADRDGVGKAFAALAQKFGRLDALVNMPASRCSSRSSTSATRTGRAYWRSI
jgi:NAD(P)-dependent dehydrogenase (short-subunit alcohol dehydrogenase family)